MRDLHGLTVNIVADDDVDAVPDDARLFHLVFHAAEALGAAAGVVGVQGAQGVEVRLEVVTRVWAQP